MHLKQPGFTYSFCRPFTKNKEGILKIKQVIQDVFINTNQIIFACSMTQLMEILGIYLDKQLLDKHRPDKAYNIAKKFNVDFNGL